MNKKMSKRQRDIKSKLMAAVAMLLVSSIMMVSTTYAWFTLSTAPEVTGITTSVGANGNLEMALMPEDAFTAVGDTFGITSESGDSMAVKDKTEANITWGNLVDLSDESYGLNTIKLYPAALNTVEGTDDAQGNPTTLGGAFLQTPEYGSDGRVSDLVAKSVTGLYNGSAFNTSDLAGVRAVGNASGMSERQIAYRNALQEGSTNATQALNKATNSLNQRGSKLASIAIKHGTSGGGETYGQEDVAVLNGMIADLDVIMGHLEKAYMKYIEAYVLSSLGMPQDAAGDLLAQGFVGTVAGYTSVDQIIALVGTADGGNVTIPDTALTPINALKATMADVAEAEAALADLTGDSLTWAEISTALSPLLNTSGLLVNGFTVEEVKTDTNGFANAVLTQGGVTVTMPSGSGVYSDIADHAGNYQSAIVIDEISYGGTTFTDMNARMSTDSTVTPPYLTVLNGVTANKAPSSEGSSGDAPITDMYGYVIDLAFRTNASDSKLLLQTEAMGRIYGENDSAETMGHGATMTFDSTVATFTVDNVKELMKTIRIVFFNPVGNSVLATAKLDMLDESVEVVGTSVTAPIKLYKIVDGAVTNYVTAPTGTAGTHYVDGQGLYHEATPNLFKDGETYRAASEGEVATWIQLAGADTPDDTTDDTYAEVIYVEETTNAGTTSTQWLEGPNAVITALDQNTAQAVSVLVYMDGESVTNAHVAAVANTSAVGTMNLQFSSTAALVPMEYTALMNQGGASNEGTNPTAKLASGSADGVTLSDVAFADGTITFKLAGTVEGTTYTVTAGGETLTASAEGVYTINNVTADVEVTVTANA